jgi:hypothetical protein
MRMNMGRCPFWVDRSKPEAPEKGSGSDWMWLDAPQAIRCGPAAHIGAAMQARHVIPLPMDKLGWSTGGG